MTFIKESNIKKLLLNVHNNFCNDSVLVLCNIGLFWLLFLSVLLLLKHFVSKGTKYRDVSIFLFTLIHSWVGVWLYALVISLSGDVEVNPGPRTKVSNTFSVCHWNLYSISAHNYSKVSLLKAYFTVHKFDIVCLLETYLKSKTAPDNNNLEISGYKLISSDHPWSSKRGGVCIYYNNFLHLRVLDIHICMNALMSN